MAARVLSMLSVASPLSIGPDYGWVTLAAAAISVQLLMTGMPIMKLRKDLKIDYPDMGSGRNTKHLSDEEWVRFNNYMRAHYNYVESAAAVLALLLLSGAFYPRFSAATGAIYVVGRYLYARGYRRDGAKGRTLGAIVLDIALVLLLGGAVTGSLSLLRFF